MLPSASIARLSGLVKALPAGCVVAMSIVSRLANNLTVLLRRSICIPIMLQVESGFPAGRGRNSLKRPLSFGGLV